MGAFRCALAREGAEAFRDQEVARLFVACGWTQVRIAGRMGRTQQWVALRLVFGRYLRFTTASCKSSSPPDSLTEWRFRQAWSASGKRRKESEGERFERVRALLALLAEKPPWQ